MEQDETKELNEVGVAFEEFLKTRRDHRDGLTARQQLWTAFEAGAQFAIDRFTAAIPKR